MNMRKSALWSLRGRNIGPRGWIGGWKADLPGTNELRPQLAASSLRDDEFCDEFLTNIWPLTPEGFQVAERIATDLAQLGFAWIWPHEAEHIIIAVAPMHQVAFLGAAA
jgi:hypothetical protein